jgi:hypothetical protein
LAACPNRAPAAPPSGASLSEGAYNEIYYGPGDLSKHAESWMWIFEVEGAERIDYFFATCSNTMGVLGLASPARCKELRRTYREVAKSFLSSCE